MAREQRLGVVRRKAGPVPCPMLRKGRRRNLLLGGEPDKTMASAVMRTIPAFARTAKMTAPGTAPHRAFARYHLMPMPNHQMTLPNHRAAAAHFRFADRSRTARSSTRRAREIPAEALRVRRFGGFGSISAVPPPARSPITRERRMAQLDALCAAPGCRVRHRLPGTNIRYGIDGLIVIRLIR